MANDLTATFGIEVPVETNAPEAADELENLRAQLAADTVALRQMQQAMRALQGGTNVNIATFRQLRDQIAAQKITIAQGTQALAQHKDAFRALTPEQAKATKGTKEYRAEQEKLAKVQNKEFASGMMHALGVLSPRLGHAGRALQDFGQGFRAMGAARGVAVGGALAVAAALALVAAAAAAVVYAVGKATKALIEFGVAAADVRRTERIMLQAASATLWWGNASEAAGQQAQLAVDKVARKMPIARAEVAGFAKQLATAQLKGQDLEKALRAVSIAAAAGQDTSGLIGAFSMARLGVGSIDALADRVEKRFGHIARARMLSLDVQTTKLKENLAGLFAKVNVTPFLEGIQRIFALFDTTTVSGWAMRESLTAIFSILGKDFKNATPTVEALFKIGLIGVLKLTLAMVKLRAGVAEWLAQHPRAKAFLLEFITGTGEAATNFERIEGALRKVGGSMVTLFRLMQGPQGWVKIGKDLIGDFVQGIIEGVKNSIARVVNAVRELGAAAADTLRKAWLMRSPSRLTMNMADQGFVQGAVVGLQKGQPRVQDAMRDVFRPAPNVGREPMPVAAPSSTSRGGGPVTVNIHVHVPQGTTDAEGFGRKVGQGMRAELGEVLEEIAHTLGAKLQVA